MAEPTLVLFTYEHFWPPFSVRPLRWLRNAESRRRDYLLAEVTSWPHDDTAPTRVVVRVGRLLPVPPRTLRPRRAQEVVVWIGGVDDHIVGDEFHPFSGANRAYLVYDDLEHRTRLWQEQR